MTVDRAAAVAGGGPLCAPALDDAGHMGVDQVTVQNLDVVKVDPELNMIVVRGAIPGPKGSVVTIHDSVKA